MDLLCTLRCSVVKTMSCMACHGNYKFLVHTHLKPFQRVAKPVDVPIVCSTPEEEETAQLDAGATASAADAT